MLFVSFKLNSYCDFILNFYDDGRSRAVFYLEASLSRKYLTTALPPFFNNLTDHEENFNCVYIKNVYKKSI